ncbi:MAG TPA: hypothetical protein VH062_14985 [Polyangiaceae bacterium]|nr:hypothetical protein [Polyangiaceae bacterium]
MVSDVHLGSDINDGRVAQPARSRSVDEDLCSLFAHYQDNPAEGKPWRLIINGDFIDFIGMSVDASSRGVSTEPNGEERAHGLGTAEDHARVKLARVAARHRAVFTALARFVAAGNDLTIVPGNHDREFHWGEVRDDFRALLFRALDPGSGSTEGEREFAAHVEFSPWFVWIEGVAYIEHGHQYDPFCASDHVMSPLSPQDPRRLSSGFSDVLLRFVVHPTAGVRECDHDNMGLVAYLGLAVRLGVRGGIDLARRFACASIELFRLHRLSLTRAARALHEEHERCVSRLAAVELIEPRRLRTLLELQARPVTRSVRAIMSGVLLDELLLAIVALAALVIFESFGFGQRHFALLAMPLVVAWWLAHRVLSRTRHIDPQNQLAARAAPLAQLFPAAFVVMGHTHVPVRVSVDDGRATYVNTGSWVEDESLHPDAASVYRAARTHLVIRERATGPHAELLAWDSITGPRPFGAT